MICYNSRHIDNLWSLFTYYCRQACALIAGLLDLHRYNEYDGKRNSPVYAVKIFYSYARQDKRLRDELEMHLEPLKRSGQITTWYDREILPGKNWDQEIENQLNTADIILLLLSSNFVSSNYCYGQEMQQALRRLAGGDVYLIPILLRPIRWQELPIGKLQALPINGKPVSSWRNRDEAFEDIAQGLQRVVNVCQLRKANQNRSLNIITDQFILKMLYAFRVPFTALSGFLELVTQFNKELDAQSRDSLLHHAILQTEQIGLIADWLVQLTLISRQPALKELHLIEVVYDVIQSMEHRLKENHPLHVEISSDLVIKADKAYVHQVLSNLLSNACKYTPIGTSVNIYTVPPENSAELLSSSSHMTFIRVKDFGPGIPPDELPLLFEPFQRLRRDLVRTVPGLGLGLYVSNQLVEILGGRLWVESTGLEGEGSCFSFTLPTA